MNPLDFLNDMEASRWCGTTYLAVYQKPVHAEWESSIFEHLPATDISFKVLKESLIRIDSSEIAYAILTTLLRLDLVYGAKIMSLKKAKFFADKFYSLFSNQAVYFSNSTWNRNQYTHKNRDFELGLSTWSMLLDATVDSGIIICDSDKIGIAWFADDD